MVKQEDFDITFAKRNFFKYSTLGILIILLMAQCGGALFSIRVIPEAISLGVAFICIMYLWLTERKDIEFLKEANLKLLRAQEDLKASHVDTILALVLSQESKDSYTYGHSERVKRFSILLANMLGLSKGEIETIARGAKLHDIGKIGLKDDVLFSKEQLTSEQFDVIKTHPVKGVTILDPLKFLEREKLIVRHHHERFDGSGYPDSLKGESIPLGARIVCVADAFDAMRSQRLYNNPLPKEEIVKRFTEKSGIQFDPKIVDVFVRNINRFYAL